MNAKKNTKETSQLEKKNMEIKKAFNDVKSGKVKIDDIDESIKDKVAKMVEDDVNDSINALHEEFDAQKQMELVKLTIASNQAQRIDKVSDIAYSYYQYTGKTIDPNVLATCVEDLKNHVLSASSIVADWTFEQFCVDNDNWVNPMNVLLPEYEPGMSVEDVWWMTYLFHDMSGHGQSASSLHMKIDELIARESVAVKNELRK